MDLNDLRYFSLVVDHGGFSAAERHAGITRSKLSRRVAALEDRLGVRLLQRTTRRLSLTEAGRVFHEHCAAMVVEADAAAVALEQLRAEPSGTIRVSCPLAMLQGYVGTVITSFMRRYPRVSIELEATDRVVNVVEERMDVVVRAQPGMTADPGLVARRIGSGHFVLVASPDYVRAHPDIETPAQVLEVDTIGRLNEGVAPTWNLVADDGRTARITPTPRLRCSDLTMQLQAAIGGIGVAMLPLRIVWPSLAAGSLVRVARRWGTPPHDIHLIYPSRRGMLPSVRAFIDYLAEQVPIAFGEAG